MIVIDAARSDQDMGGAPTVFLRGNAAGGSPGTSEIPQDVLLRGQVWVGTGRMIPIEPITTDPREH